MSWNKKVLFIHHGGIAGGAPLSMLYTMQGMRDKGWQPIVGVIRPFEELHDLYNSHGFETFKMPYIPIFITWSGGEGKRWNPFMWQGVYRAWRKWNTAKRLLLEFIKENNVGLVHLNSVALSNPASMLMEENLPFVWHIREHGPRHKGNRFRFLQRRLFQAKNVIFLSKAEQNSWLEGKKNGTVVHNFIDFKTFDFRLNSDQLRSELQIERNKKIILYVGGSKLHKGILPLLKALSILKEKWGEAFVCLMPDTFIEPTKATKTQKQILELIKKYSLESQCKMMPFNPNIIGLFALCDLLTFPATKPHFARPIIEASAMKKPVIASNLKAIDELVIENETGFLVPANNSEALAEKIFFLFSNLQECERMGENGYRFAQQNFEFNRQIDKIEKVYKDCVG
jgi:glycosyltransferase involved in cell wall biosynthesis